MLVPAEVKHVESLINYKGIYAEVKDDQKFTCPTTGAHFRFNDLIDRLQYISEKRADFQ